MTTDIVDNSNSVETKKRRKILSVGLVQTAVSDNVSYNMKKTAEKVEEAAKKGAKIVCLQELYRAKYFPQDENCEADKFAETIPGESTKLFSEIAARNKICLVVPIFEKTPKGKYYNSAAMIDSDGKLLGWYRKIHIPCDPCFYEKNYFEAGDTGYAVFKTRYARVGVLICYDQWFPEPARVNTLMGADIIFYPTAIGTISGYDSSEGDWHEAWKTVQRANAISNGVHIAAVNRVGQEGQLRFWGGSFVCDSFGQILKEASSEKEEVLITKIDLNKNMEVREGWGFLRNRRPDTYSALVSSNQLRYTDEK